jgi:hypothetical protein
VLKKPPVKVKVKVQMKKLDLGSAVTSTSAFFLVPLRGRNGVPYDGTN